MILIREGSSEIKMTTEKLLQGETFHTVLDEQIVFNELDHGDSSVWSLLLSSGYLKAINCEYNEKKYRMEYDLQLTNLEVQIMFQQMAKGWFGSAAV